MLSEELKNKLKYIFDDWKKERDNFKQIEKQFDKYISIRTKIDDLHKKIISKNKEYFDNLNEFKKDLDFKYYSGNKNYNKEWLLKEFLKYDGILNDYFLLIQETNSYYGQAFRWVIKGILEEDINNYNKLIENIIKNKEISPVRGLYNIAYELFGFYNLSKENRFVYNKRITDFFEYIFYKNKINSPYDIENEYNQLKIEYKSFFKGDLFIENVTSKLEKYNYSKEELKNIQLNIQIDQMIYYYTKYFLAPPFNNIFDNKNEAVNFFKILSEKLELLGIISGDDELFTINMFKNRNLIRLIYSQWVVIDFEKTNSNKKIIRFCLKERSSLNKYDKEGPFKLELNEDKYFLYDIPYNEFLEKINKEINKYINEDFSVLKEHFSNRSKTGFSKNCVLEIKKNIFNPNKLNKILVNGVNDIFNEHEKEILHPKNKNDIINNNLNDINYFWVTVNPNIWKVNKIKKEGFVFYTSTNNKGNKRRIYSAYEEAKKNDKVIFYESTPVRKIIAEGTILKGLHRGVDPETGEEKEGIKIEFTRYIDPINWKSLIDIKELENSSVIANGAQGSLFKLTKEEYDTILSLEELDEVLYSKKNYTWENVYQNLKYKNITNKPFKFVNNKLYFESYEKEKIERMINQAIIQKKHIILIGPPGTGKSKLAKQICEHYLEDENKFSMITAISDWSTFDTIGGLYPKENNELEFRPGLILNCFKNKNYEDINRWLIIDEINRTDIDKAFGSLFSALTGDTIELAYKINEKQVKIIGRPKDKDKLNKNVFFIHPDWRIIATMNSLDKSSLYEMSFAFMRRFAFIPVNIPNNIDTKLIKNYCICWNIKLSEKNYDLVSKLWIILSNNDIQIGPSIIKDVCEYIKDNKSFEEAITLFILPQLEGKNEEDVIKLFSDFEKIELNPDKFLKKDFSTFLGFKINFNKKSENKE